jgi:tol-pal system protein YbgF
MGRLGRFPALVTLAVAAGCLGVVSGCASGGSAREKELEDMKSQIAQMRTENDRLAERISTLEITRGVSGGGHGGTALGDDVPGNLRVIRLGPGLANDDGDTIDGPSHAPAGMAGGADSGDDGDSGPRPVIAASGSGGRHGKASNETSGSANDPEARRAYDAALAKVNKKDYPGALDAFTAFLVHWPDHPRADNAMYWRGECYYAQGDFGRAADELSGVLARFPDGNKAPDALLKLGMAEQKLGRTADAQESFSRLSREFPRAEATRKIPAAIPATAVTAAPATPAGAGENR